MLVRKEASAAEILSRCSDWRLRAPVCLWVAQAFDFQAVPVSRTLACDDRRFVPEMFRAVPFLDTLDSEYIGRSGCIGRDTCHVVLRYAISG